MQDITNIEEEKEFNEMRRHHRRGRIFMGIVIILIGKVLLLHRLGVELPEWLMSSGALIAAIGLAFGAKHLFRPGFWMIVFLVGLAKIAEILNPGIEITHLIWPCILILVGIAILFKPKWHKKHHDRCGKQKHMGRNRGQWKKNWEARNTHISDGDMLESVSVFGGAKRNVISKDFKGGEVVCVFGGAEIDLMQADIKEKAELEVVAVFGGVKLIVPAHWLIRHEITTIMGGTDDKRPISSEPQEGRKILVLKGTVVFGGVDINSY